MKRPHPVIERLKQERLRAGMSRPQAAQRLFVSEPTLYGRERGQHEPSTLADLDRWAALFGLRVELVPVDEAERLGEAS